MADETKKESAPVPEEKLDPVDQVLERLDKEELPHDAVLNALDDLQEKVRSQNVQVSKEKLAKLRAETTSEIQKDIKTLSDKGPDKEFKDSTLLALEQRLQAIEQQADRRPEWIKKSEGMVSDMWQKFRSVPGVGETLDWIGDMTGKTLKSGADLWAWVKGAVLGAIANGDFTKNPKIMEWAKMKLNEEAVAEGIQFSVNKAKKGQILTENSATKKMESRPIKARFDPVYSTDDIRAWSDVLAAGQWGDKLDSKTATAYVDQYIKEKAPKENPANEIVITVDALVKAGLTKPMQAKTAEENKKIAEGEKSKGEKKPDEKKESEPKV